MIPYCFRQLPYVKTEIIDTLFFLLRVAILLHKTCFAKTQRFCRNRDINIKDLQNNFLKKDLQNPVKKNKTDMCDRSKVKIFNFQITKVHVMHAVIQILLVYT